MSKNKLLFSLLALIAAFAAGRYTASSPSVTEATTAVKNTRTTIVKTQTPDGTIKTITTKDTNTQVSQNKTVSAVSPKTNVSLLGAYDYRAVSKMSYGLSVSREVIGPVTAGVFGLNNGILGLSIGVNF